MNQVDGIGWPAPTADVQKSLRVVKTHQPAGELESGVVSPPFAADGEHDIEARLDTLARRIDQLEGQAGEARKSRAETARTSRWLNVRVMVLEESLKAAEFGAEELSRKLGTCLTSLREQEDRLTDRLSQLERDLGETRTDNSRISQEIISLREARAEVTEKLEELAMNLVVATEQAEALALTSQQSAVARFSEVEEELSGLSERSEAVAIVAEDARVRAQDSLDVTGMVIEGLEEVTDLSTMVRRIAEEARGRVEELEVGQTESTLKQALVERLAEVEAEFADFAEELAELAEDSGEVRVLAEKAHGKSEHALSTAESQQADLDAKTEAIYKVLEQKAGTASVEQVRKDLDAQSDELRSEMRSEMVALEEKAAQAANESAEAVRRDVEWQSEELREELAGKASKSSLDDFDDAIQRLRSQLDMQARQPSRPTSDRPRKKWEAHLADNAGDSPAAQLALPAGASSSKKAGKKSKSRRKKK